MERKSAWLALLVCLGLSPVEAGAQPAPTAAGPTDAPATASGSAGNTHGTGLMAQAELAESSGKHREAAEIYRRVLALEPDATEAAVGLGIALVNGHLGKESVLEAAALLEEVVKARADDARAWLALGMAYRETAQDGPAVSAYKKYLQLVPGGQTAREVQKAIEEIEKKPSGPSSEASELLQKGVDLFRDKHFPEAKAAFSRCIELAPELARCHMMLGSVYARLGKQDLGAREYRAFLKLAPDDPKAADVRKLLQTYEHR